MIWIRREGELLRQGFNIYPWNDPSSRGFVLRIGNNIYRCRYSYKLQKLCISQDKIT
jgi:hypothetical protein